MSGSSSDSALRQALIGVWRLVSIQREVGGTLVKPLGNDPVGYLIYTRDGHMSVQFAARERRELFRASTPPGRGMVLLETTEGNTPIGFMAYCGRFEVRDGEVRHHIEVGINPSMSGRVEARSVARDSDRLILSVPNGGDYEWQRVEPPVFSSRHDG